MCEYEKYCVEKPVSPIMRRNELPDQIREIPCECNTFSCHEYKDRRYSSRLHSSGIKGQKHLSC